ncbi:MAG: SDR family oxidoreductase [Acidimicrobiia bacterium]|nr:SDR family oxidoreductase [Acidimicrobiia bacterium]
MELDATGRLAGKVAIVTGTSPNIGGTIASGFAAQGAAVACNDRRAEVAEERAERIRAEAGKAIAVPGDVTDPEAVGALVDRVLGEWGRVDVLVNNAVRFNTKGVLDMPVEEFRHQVDVILGGAFLMTQRVGWAMVEAGRGGSIVNILSTAAWQGQAGNIGYCTAKSGLVNFTRSAAMELAPYGIRVNAFTPTATMPVDPQLADRFRRATAGSTSMDFAGQLPLGRLPTPADYLGALVYLASDESAMTTGTNITVDGGALAKYWPQAPARREGGTP